jgi:hypothetical protein
MSSLAVSIDRAHGGSLSTHKRLALTVTTAWLAACASGGGMYNQPYALFEPHERSQIQELEPAFVMSIDGRSRGLGDSNEPVTPGVRRVELSIPGPRGMSNPESETLEVDAKPCMRYRFGARRPSPTARDWHATVEATEPIGECLKKFPAVK